MSKSGFGQMYRRLSSKLLDLVVTPHVLGEVPTENQISENENQENSSSEKAQKITCYVLQNYSRSNALVVDSETRRLNIAPALDPLLIGNHTEKAAVVFLQQQDESNLLHSPTHTFPPRLLRLIDALDQSENDLLFYP